MSVVVDASFAVAWTATGKGTALEREVAALLDDDLLAPPIFWLEVASALRGMALRGEIDDSFRGVAFGRIRKLKVQSEPPSDRLDATIAVSDRYQLTVYDAAYLELAIRTGSALATRDKALISAAAKAGVPLVPA